MHPSTNTTAGRGDFRVVVDSIGAAGAGMVRVLKEVSPLAESRLAQLLYQAPSELMTDLDRDSAEKLSQVLATSGLRTRVLASGDSFEPGDADHELAVAVRSPRRMPAVAQLLVELLGVDAHRARKMLCLSPTVLLGRISANTAAAISRRLTALGDVEVDVSRTSHALFDVFLGACSPSDRARVVAELRGLGIEVADHPSLLATGLTKADGDRLWRRLGRSGLPVQLVNRDFERFDVRLDAAADTPGMLAYLSASTGMPDEVARKVVASTPIVVHHDMPFAAMIEQLETIHRHGGRASGHLLAFQSFALRVIKVGEVAESTRLVELLADTDQAAAVAALRPDGVIAGPLSPPQARWLQWELGQVQTETELQLR